MYYMNPFTPKLKKIKCTSDVAGIGSIIIFHLSNLWKAKFYSNTVWCYISGELAGEMWNWSLLGMKGLKLGTEIFGSFMGCYTHQCCIQDFKTGGPSDPFL